MVLPVYTMYKHSIHSHVVKYIPMLSIHSHVVEHVKYFQYFCLFVFWGNVATEMPQRALCLFVCGFLGYIARSENAD